jgi:ribonucleoside-diphosphate reductase alpha chain
VATTIARWVRLGRYLGTARDARVFEDELTWLLLHQRAAFNSPVWFNVGIDARAQAPGCFILGLEDHLDSILDLARIEGRIFSKGSGAGTNFSRLRGSREHTRSGGCASGPVAFLRGLDALAGAVKSGGRTRRAAKMALLDADHPDVLDFVRSKAEEEERARALAVAGFFTAGDVARDPVVGFQNENHSVRVPDAFLEAAVADGPWRLVPRTRDGRAETIRARDLLRAAAAAAHACGDPGLQFADTIERWNPVPRTGPIRASNPCSEFVFLDDTACNLASINVAAFRDAAGDLDVEPLRAAVRVLLLAMEALVSRSSYPTPRIARNSERLRPLGLGLANVGSLLLSRALPYDSDAGRGLAAGIAALVGGEASACSAELAARRGPFAEWALNREPALAVLRRHRDAARALSPEHVPAPLLAAARASWDRAVALATRTGLRNAQVSCIAPTGTISFLMDCDTTGIEPELALVKEKKLVGGGRLRLANRSLSEALARLGYGPTEAQAVLAHVERTGAAEGAPGLRASDLPVFDAAMPARPGGRALSAEAHLAMMAAVQPFVSGAISKTVNLPAEATVEDVERIFVAAWRLGLKAVAVYRDRSKVAQPLVPARAAGNARSTSRRQPSPRPVARPEPEAVGAEAAVGTSGERCPTCAGEMQPGGSCFACPNCGAATGCG